MRRYGVTAEGNGLAFGPGRIGTDAVKYLGRRVPQVQVPEDAFDDIGVVDEREESAAIHRSISVGACEAGELITF